MCFIVICSSPLLPTSLSYLLPRQALENLRAILDAAGTNLDAVVKTTVLMTDMAHYGEVNAIYSEFFTENPPARAAYAAAALPAGALIESE